MLKNQRGMNPIILILFVMLLIIIAVSGYAGYNYFQEKQKKSEITSFKAQLEQSEQTYLTSHGYYAVKPPMPFDEGVMPEYVSRFFKQVAYFSAIPGTKSLYEGANKEYQADYDPNFLVSKTSPVKTAIDSVIMSKILNMDIDSLISNKYLAQGPLDPQNYFISTVTGKTYHVSESTSIEEMANEAKRLVEESGMVTNLSRTANISLAKDGKKMDKIITSVTNRDFILFGGEGTMRLVKAKIVKDVNGNVTYELTDLTGELTNNVSTDAVTEIRLVSNTSAVVHYYDSVQKKMMYLSITF